MKHQEFFSRNSIGRTITTFPDSIYPCFGQQTAEGDFLLGKNRRTGRKSNKRTVDHSNISSKIRVAGNKVPNLFFLCAPIDQGYEAMGIRMEQMIFCDHLMNQSVHLVNIFSYLCSSDEHFCSSEEYFVHNINNKTHVVRIYPIK